MVRPIKKATRLRTRSQGRKETEAKGRPWMTTTEVATLLVHMEGTTMIEGCITSKHFVPIIHVLIGYKSGCFRIAKYDDGWAET